MVSTCIFLAHLNVNGTVPWMQNHAHRICMWGFGWSEAAQLISTYCATANVNKEGAAWMEMLPNELFIQMKDNNIVHFCCACNWATNLPSNYLLAFTVIQHFASKKNFKCVKTIVIYSPRGSLQLVRELESLTQSQNSGNTVNRGAKNKTIMQMKSNRHVSQTHQSPNEQWQTSFWLPRWCALTIAFTKRKKNTGMV